MYSHVAIVFTAKLKCEALIFHKEYICSSSSVLFCTWHRFKKHLQSFLQSVLPFHFISFIV